jgi:hypothetical protein
MEQPVPLSITENGVTHELSHDERDNQEGE